MGKHEASLREIVKGLDGLIMLNEWEATLARDIRAKAEAAVRETRDEPAEGPSRGGGT